MGSWKVCKWISGVEVCFQHLFQVLGCLLIRVAATGWDLFRKFGGTIEGDETPPKFCIPLKEEPGYKLEERVIKSFVGLEVA